jgi:hypothetical protein
VIRYHDLFATCCDTWHRIDAYDPPARCPFCRCKWRWGYDKTANGDYPYIKEYIPARSR